MSSDLTTPSSFWPRDFFGRASALAADWLLAAGILFAIDALAHRKLTVGGFLLFLAGWLLAAPVARMVKRADSQVLIELLFPLIWLSAGSCWLKQPWSLPQILYAVGLVFAAWRLWRWLVGCRSGESWRLLMVGGVAGLLMAPFFTDLQLGGQDAKWYTSVFIDFVGQLRAGVFPVFIGQGDLSFNGSVNLFRSAPLCLWLGGLWDLLTWQSLSAVAIRNLAVITAALGAGYGMYAALLGVRTDDRPEDGWSRWLAAFGALVYLLCPGNLLALYFYELQMTFTALLALPWILYGNIRSLREPGGKGYAVLAVGLTLAWLAHAPLAILAIFITAALQLGWFAFEPEALQRGWKAAAGGGVIFILLSAYYFLGMTELAGVGGPGLSREAGTILGSALVVFAAIRVLCYRQWAWLAGLAAGLALAAVTPAWLGWALLWCAGSALAVAGLRWAGVKPTTGGSILLLGGVGLVAAALAQGWATGHAYPADLQLLKDLSRDGLVRSQLFQPLAADLTKYGNTQPGYAVWALILVAVAGVIRRREVVLSLLVGVMGLMLAMVLQLPRASEFLVGYFPPQVGGMINLPMLYRMIPPLSVLGIFAGYLVLWRLAPGRRAVRGLVLGSLVGVVVWNAIEIRPVIAIGFSHTATRSATEQMFSPDTYALGRYPYGMLYSPLHFMDGKRLPLMDSRLLTLNYDLIVGPDQLAKEAEQEQSEVQVLTSRVDESYPEWLHFTPGWVVQPGETRFLRFEFAEGMDCSGWLIMSSHSVYREYQLAPGYDGAGFGAGPLANHTLALSNTGNHSQHYTMRMKMDAGNTLPRDGGAWGRLHLSRYRPEIASVEVKSLVPYRVRVVMSEEGYLETPRQWIAGYRAWVDGRRVSPVRVKSGMLGIPLESGAHEVVVRFVGSARLWVGFLVSGATLLLLLIRGLGGTQGERKLFNAIIRTWEAAKLP